MNPRLSTVTVKDFNGKVLAQTLAPLGEFPFAFRPELVDAQERPLFLEILIEPPAEPAE